MKWKELILAIIICELAGIIGSAFTLESVQNWYSYLEKPDFNPPNWIFGPVWTSLYFMMGISVFLVFVSGKEGSMRATLLFAGQLVLNTLWSIAFFGMQSPFFGLIVIAMLWIMIVATIISFYPISKKAAYLLIPYIFWVSFAAVLNYSIWMLNG
ncbi:tryptophan-rich sensory protein [Candidatus Micrarchaeota archaeon]|nr:tryptophan-rich sensory protein [Candidatus Micrarchaeota archaeon]